MNRPSDIWIEIQKTLPDVDLAELRQRVEFSLELYRSMLLLSRDTAPTLPQLLRWLQNIRINLAEIVKILNLDESAFLILGLNYELDGKSGNTEKFPVQIVELLQATERAISNLEKGTALAINGVPHTRKTRTETRDEWLIPMLTGHFLQLGVDPTDVFDELYPMDPSIEHEFIDRACNFVHLVLTYADIPAPDIGPDVGRFGEPAQGRLRRAVKEAARGLTNSGLKPAR